MGVVQDFAQMERDITVDMANAFASGTTSCFTGLSLMALTIPNGFGSLALIDAILVLRPALGGALRLLFDFIIEAYVLLGTYLEIGIIFKEVLGTTVALLKLPPCYFIVMF